MKEDEGDLPNRPGRPPESETKKKQGLSLEEARPFAFGLWPKPAMAEPPLGRVAEKNLGHTTKETFSARSSEDLVRPTEETSILSVHHHADH